MFAFWFNFGKWIFWWPILIPLAIFRAISNRTGRRSQAKHSRAVESMTAILEQAIAQGNTNASSIAADMQELGEAEAMVEACARAAKMAYRDIAAAPQALETIRQVGTQLGLQHSQMGTAVTRSAERIKILEDLQAQTLQEHPSSQSQSIFNLQGDEKLLWFEEVEYYTFVTHTELVGRANTGGLSYRLTDNISISGARSDIRQRVETHEDIEQLDRGNLGITDRHVYFFGNDRHRFRQRYDQITSIDVGDDGITIVRDERDARPEIFINGNGWYLYHLVTNLSRTFRP